MGEFFDLGECEVTLFIRDAVWHNFSWKRQLSATLITEMNAEHEQRQPMCLSLAAIFSASPQTSTSSNVLFNPSNHFKMSTKKVHSLSGLSIYHE